MQINCQMGVAILTSQHAEALISAQGLNVVIPGSFTSVDDNAFYGKGIQSVEIPESIVTIGSHAFFNNNLTVIDLPNQLVKIGDSAFQANHLNETFSLNRTVTDADGESNERGISCIIAQEIAG